MKYFFGNRSGFGSVAAAGRRSETGAYRGPSAKAYWPQMFETLDIDADDVLSEEEFTSFEEPGAATEA